MTTTKDTYGIHARGRGAKQPVPNRSLLQLSCDICQRGFSYMPCHPGTYAEDENGHLALRGWACDAARAGQTYMVGVDGRKHTLSVHESSLSLPRIQSLLQEWRYTRFGTIMSLKRLRNSRLEFRLEDQTHWFKHNNPDVSDPGYWNNMPVRDASGQLHFIARTVIMSSDPEVSRRQWAVCMRNICNTLFGPHAFPQVPNPFAAASSEPGTKEQCERHGAHHLGALVSQSTELDRWDFEYDGGEDMEMGFGGGLVAVR
ncbi:hypothetical protein KVR01_002663 [Diaporthe batatas]|uniref:uncharacterized protein n=1 Tax=Diaporthe batatas TaxID=748121 RepID=UPI001D03F4EF|nr:uncharacterized protein KVR01_002663 [Diaporthe batatas]KAG8166974.1 hypothetical protein KVR01_002663 [Diaporthe batatas]